MCGSTELNYFSSSSDSNTSSEVTYAGNITKFNTTEQDLLLLVASWMTKVSLIYEFVVGFIIIYSLVAVYHFRCNKMNDSMLPFLLLDSLVIIILGPFGNVYMFVLGCAEAILTIGIRIGFYLSTISLSAIYVYLSVNDNPQRVALKTFVIVLFKLAIKLITCSSCLATFINIAYPETPVFRYFYLCFTILIGFSALLTYYETLLKLVEIVSKRHCLRHDRCCEWFNHCTFWAHTFANVCLIGMNAFILHKYIDIEGFDSSGISLVLNVISVTSGAILYVLGATFCGSQPLYKVLYKNCCHREDKSSATSYQAGINYYVIVY